MTQKHETKKENLWKVLSNQEKSKKRATSHSAGIVTLEYHTSNTGMPHKDITLPPGSHVSTAVSSMENVWPSWS
jgi:hypothetical protein